MGLGPGMLLGVNHVSVAVRLKGKVGFEDVQVVNGLRLLSTQPVMLRELLRLREGGRGRDGGREGGRGKSGYYIAWK